MQNLNDNRKGTFTRITPNRFSRVSELTEIKKSLHSLIMYFYESKHYFIKPEFIKTRSSESNMMLSICKVPFLT